MRENIYNKKKLKYLEMLRGCKPERNAYGVITKAAEFQKTTAKTGRIQPDRKWFRASKTVSQLDLDAYREASKIETPYNVLLKTGNVPYSLLTEKTKKKNKVDFDDVFGKTAIRKKPKLEVKSLEELAIKKNIEVKDEKEVKKDLVKGQSSRIWLELYKVLDSSDVIIHVLDARDPLGTLCEKILTYIKEEAPHKHLIYLLNKVDLVPTGITAKWLKYFSDKHTALAFHAQSIENNFGKSSLINLLRQLEKLYNKKHISVGFVGYPNIGKSSIINALRNKSVCNVAPVPGETKVWQYITLTRGIYLVDCPGVVPISDYTQAVFKGAIRVENIENPEEYVEVLLKSHKQQISLVYNLEFSNFDDFIEKFAVRYGKLIKGNKPNLDLICKNVLHDWNRGKIPFYSEPPQET
ncbi:Nucleolar GTP-binding protein 2 [Nosema bombycis CQ1]|uniref:Nucleolar GTP-binding protein 2 n=1 Tax=Nosema bombycis (strain CQ1 / CVCC 102059) TaxID=578461 RepID=R0MLA4_NOSB1|nr:Nucleolar GTP-binding protein 2 [Nosema bombycis CQ1]|eukprot:EOB13608.1 Nucleolar GTP-binding protein 2 [Nosema bombycis CQ1]